MAWGEEDRNLSELERELELEFEEPEGEFEGIGDDREQPTEGFEEPEGLEAPEPELDEPSRESRDEEQRVEGYADRFYELGTQSFESEAELDDRVNRLVGDMEKEYFFGSLKKLAKKGLKWAGSPLVKKALSLATKYGVPGAGVLNSLTSLARGDMRGLLGSLAKSAIAGAVPGAGVVLPAIQALGFEASSDPESGREAWRNYVGVAQEAYETLARNATPAIVNPVAAARAANTAFNQALSRRAEDWKSQPKGPRRRITLRAGDRLLVRVV